MTTGNGPSRPSDATTSSGAYPPCPLTLGSKPWWMSADQYDASGGPCRCLLDAGHESPCVCDHTKEGGRG